MLKRLKQRFCGHTRLESGPDLRGVTTVYGGKTVDEKQVECLDCGLIWRIRVEVERKGKG